MTVSIYCRENEAFTRLFSTQFVGKELTDSWRVLGESLSEFPLGQQLVYENLFFILLRERDPASSPGLTLRAKPQSTTVHTGPLKSYIEHKSEKHPNLIMHTRFKECWITFEPKPSGCSSKSHAGNSYKL